MQLNRHILQKYPNPSDNILYGALRMTRVFFNKVLAGEEVHDRSMVAKLNYYASLKEHLTNA